MKIYTLTNIVKATILPLAINIIFFTAISAQNFTDATNDGPILSPPKLTAKVFLNSYNAGTGLMADYLKTLTTFPLNDPYFSAPLNTKFVHVNNGTTAASISPSILSVSGNNSIVDWVFVQLRTGSPGSTSVQYTKAALLQADGDIVDMDGVSAITFTSAPAGNYYVAIGHRNHTGFRTNATIFLNGSSPALNFTDNSVALHGGFPLKAISASVSVMYVGDANFDGSVDAVDSILWETQNGLFDDYHYNADYNQDGSIDAIDAIFWESNNGVYEELD
jgi:hypothetical protein